jgi:hypothetical protein
MIREDIDNSVLLYQNYSNERIVKDYYDFIIEIFRKFIMKYKPNMNLIINGNADINNGKISKTFSIQIEHTIVKKSVAREHPQSSIDHDYVVRIDQYNKHNSYNFVLEYSMPNIKNISTCPFYSLYMQKIIYLPPLNFNSSFKEEEKTKNVITTFSNVLQERRIKLLEMLKNEGVENISNTFGQNLENVLMKSKILVNIHHSEFYHTVEELRILPALKCGVIVISEDSPLREHIPYSEFVIWCKYEDIPKNVKNVIDNYDSFKKKLINEKLKQKLLEMEENIYTNIKEKICV